MAERIEISRLPVTARFRFTGREAPLTPFVEKELKRARLQAQAAVERLSILAEAGEILSTSLDAVTNLQALADLAAGRMGDWALIALLGEDRHIEACVGSQGDGPQDPAFVDLPRRILESDGLPPRWRQCMCRREPWLASSVEGELLEAALSDRAAAAALLRRGTVSSLLVPLLGRSRVLGVMLLGTYGARGALDGEDLALATELARRIALSVENATLHAEAQRAIAERKVAEEQLVMAREAAEGASAVKRALLANVSHEIRTPLGVVLGYSELLLDPQHTELERAQWISTILRNGRQLSALIDDILDLSKIETDRLEVEMLSVDVQDLIAQVASEMSRIAERKGVKLRLEWQTPPCGAIESDPTRLRQILLNVVGNALKFTEHGEVAIVAETRNAPEPALVITVRDTGSGIAEAHVAQLFQPFAQADASMTRRFGGTGVGLVLSRRLAAALGGDLKLCKTELGKGSAFSVTLPLRRSVEMPSRRGRPDEG
jgi:signal transduction histidine kinase